VCAEQQRVLQQLVNLLILVLAAHAEEDIRCRLEDLLIADIRQHELGHGVQTAFFANIFTTSSFVIKSSSFWNIAFNSSGLSAATISRNNSWTVFSSNLKRSTSRAKRSASILSCSARSVSIRRFAASTVAGRLLNLRITHSIRSIVANSAVNRRSALGCGGGGV
jgi:hypothetical protein